MTLNIKNRLFSLISIALGTQIKSRIHASKIGRKSYFSIFIRIAGNLSLSKNEDFEHS